MGERLSVGRDVAGHDGSLHGAAQHDAEHGEALVTSGDDGLGEVQLAEFRNVNPAVLTELQSAATLHIDGRCEGAKTELLGSRGGF